MSELIRFLLRARHSLITQLFKRLVEAQEDGIDYNDATTITADALPRFSCAQSSSLSASKTSACRDNTLREICWGAGGLHLGSWELADAALTFAIEQDIPKIMDLVDTELSEPYNHYTYRYFLNDW